MSSPKRLMATAATALLLTVMPLGAATEINLATVVPPLTAWANALLGMGSTWSKETEGRVTMKPFFNGSQGTEKAVLAKMRPGVGTIQATFITAGGLSSQDKAFNVFNIPFFFENDAEQLAVQTKLTPVVTDALNAKGFHFLCWGTAGWIQVFSKKPLRSLADLKAAKLYAAKDDEEMLQWFVSNGFHPVGLQIADIVPQLKLGTGMIDTAPNPPYAANITGMYKDAKYMLDLHIAPLIGALIISNTAWTKISPEDQAKMTAAALAMEKKVRDDAPRLDADSIKAMTERGLEVIKVDPKEMAVFRTEAAKLAETMKGTMVPADIYAMAVAARNAVRK